VSIAASSADEERSERGGEPGQSERGAERARSRARGQSVTPVVVVGIGADGWDGLSPRARRAVEDADVLRGSTRQLALVPDEVPAERVPWPSPMAPALAALVTDHPGRRVVVLASGDPMLSGVGASLVRLHGAGAVEVVPHPSSVTLACARLGWAVEETQVVSVVGRPVELVAPHATPGRRLLVLGSDGGTPGQVARLLADRGYGASRIVALAQLGGPAERQLTGTAADWPHTGTDPLVVTAVEVVADPGAVPLPTVPGLPDDAYASDGQLTKRDVRAVTLARLAPLPGQLLWDVGAGAGSIGIEWMRVHPSCRAVAVESSAERVRRVGENATRLGVPGLRVVEGRAPAALSGLPAPDAVFVGGGLTSEGLLEACWAALRPGGRLVANAVTVEGEAVLAAWRARAGGELVRLGVQRAEPVGGFTGWRPAMPVTIWSVTR
jgi:precorrin-6Y C5,15-methyltransferase (decarboxylating)